MCIYDALITLQDKIRRNLIRFYDPGHLLLPGKEGFWQRLNSWYGTNITVEKVETDAGAAHLENGGVPHNYRCLCTLYLLTNAYAMDDFRSSSFLASLGEKLDRSLLIWLKIIKHKEVARDGVKQI